MIQIIIFFVVASFISNIIKAISNQQSAQPGSLGEKGLADVQEVQSTREKVERRPQQHGVKVEKTTFKARTESRPKAHVISRDRSKSKDGAEFKGRSQPKVNVAKLTPNRLVEGILLSEILGPPRSRRLRN